jgi:hypothetical protein
MLRFLVKVDNYLACWFEKKISQCLDAGRKPNELAWMSWRAVLSNLRRCHIHNGCGIALRHAEQRCDGTKASAVSQPAD